MVVVVVDIYAFANTNGKVVDVEMSETSLKYDYKMRDNGLETNRGWAGQIPIRFVTILAFWVVCGIPRVTVYHTIGLEPKARRILCPSGTRCCLLVVLSFTDLRCRSFVGGVSSSPVDGHSVTTKQQYVCEPTQPRPIF